MVLHRSRVRQAFFELIECSFKSLLHICGVRFESRLFFFRCIDRRTAERNRRLTALLAEGQRGKDLQWPGRRKRVARQVLVCIGKGIDENNFLRRLDFAIDGLPPPIAAIGCAHAVKEYALWMEVELMDMYRPSFGPPPFCQLFLFGPCLPHEGPRRIEGAYNDKLLCATFETELPFSSAMLLLLCL